MRYLILVGFLCLFASVSRAEDRWELTGSSAFQVSGGGSEHIQLGVDGSFAFHRRLRVHLAGSWVFGWQTTHNENLQRLLQNVPSTPIEAPILLRQMLTIGVEGVPLTGQATLLSLPLDLDLFLRLDAGAANSRVELQWPEESGSKTTTAMPVFVR